MATPTLPEITPSRYIAITNPVYDKLAVRCGFLIFLRSVESATGKAIEPNTPDAERIVDAFFDGLSSSEAALWLSNGGTA